MSSERACALAALIIHDDGLEVTAERILAVTAAAGIEVESIWASLFEKAMKGTNVDSLLASFSAAPAAGAVCAAPAASGAAAAEASGKKEEKKVEKPESDEEMGFGLFD